MPVVRVLFISFVSILIACNYSNTEMQNFRRIIVEDVTAEGDISSDSIFNGLIKFYDTATNKLVMKANYKYGKLNGQRKDYYLNGKLKGLGQYENGKRNGIFSTFDSLGQITSKHDFYYDLRAGNSLEYERGEIKSYYFTSFENNELFAIDYDSLEKKDISTINDNSFYFYHIKDVATITTTDKRYERKEGFIYLVNPPMFDFHYDLCVINPKDSILRVEKTFDMDKIWSTFNLNPTTLKENEGYCLRLCYDRKLNDKEREAGTMLKRL